MTDNRTSGVTTYTYDQANQLSTMAYPNGVSHGFQYDVRDRTVQLNVNGPSGAITSCQQTFSYSGRKLSATELSGRAANYTYSHARHARDGTRGAREGQPEQPRSLIFKTRPAKQSKDAA